MSLPMQLSEGQHGPLTAKTKQRGMSARQVCLINSHMHGRATRAFRTISLAAARPDTPSF